MPDVFVYTDHETASMLKGQPFSILAGKLQQATALALSDGHGERTDQNHRLGILQSGQVGVRLVTIEQSFSAVDILIEATAPHTWAREQRLEMWTEALKAAVIILKDNPQMCWGLKDKTVLVRANLPTGMEKVALS